MSKEAVAEMKAFAQRRLEYWRLAEGVCQRLNLPERSHRAYKRSLFEDLLANLNLAEMALNRQAARRVA